MSFRKQPPSSNDGDKAARRRGGGRTSSSSLGGNSKDNVCVQQLENVVDLLQRKACGDKVTSDQVEAAISGVLTDMGVQEPPPPPPPPPAAKSTSSTRKMKKRKINDIPGSAINTQPQIQLDMNNYDDDDDDDQKDNTKTNGNAKSEPDKDTAREKESNTNDDGEDEDDEFQDEDGSYEDQLSQIPLGKEGAKMMTTFGDGPKPNLEALRMALLGTRKSIQLAIMDARAIRRRAKQNFDDAKQSIAKRRPKAVQADSIDPNMLYRAIAAESKTDKLGRNIKCGFDVEQLRWLFPEEMRSYQRWNEMHSEYTKTDKTDKQVNGGGAASDVDNANSNNKDDSAAGGETNKDEVVVDDPHSEDKSSSSDDDTMIIGGHLRERAANFDVRTEKMKSDWYTQKFSKVRQGSFLPKGFVAHRERSSDEVDWDNTRKKRKLGRQSGDDTWQNMSSITVRFLHWLGFDPPALHPPNAETTQALAFLGYDMLGKIVEKAIFLKNLEKMMENNLSEIDESKVLWELEKGDQLTKEDIDKAMDHPDVRPSSLHTTATAAAADEEGGISTSHQPSFQLYFGPGFEERLELEMEELVASEKKIGLSQDEIRTREQEALLFSKISSPPTGLTQLLEQRKSGKVAGTEEEKGADGENGNDGVCGGGDEELEADEGGKHAETTDEQK